MKKQTNLSYEVTSKNNTGITRKEALKKAGKYAAFTAATIVVILSPKESQAQSPAPPGSGW